eukprot:scaffold111188_cov62-Phaeocystis_antarctica.AAC.6
MPSRACRTIGVAITNRRAVMRTLLLCARLAGAACYVFSSGALTPVPTQSRAAVLALEDPTEVLGVVAATLAGGAALLSQTSLLGSKDKKTASAPSPPSSSPSSSSPPPPPPPPKIQTKPPAAPAPSGKEWQSRGGSGGPHRMSGTWPKEAQRQLVRQCGGAGYHRMAGRLAPKKAAVSSNAGTSQMAKRIVGMFIAVIASLRLSLINGAMVIAVSFVVYGLEQSTKESAWQRLRRVFNGVKAGVGSLFRRKGEWPAMGGTSGYHRMAGRLGKTVAVTATAAAAAATPSATPAAAATASVASWYDAGTRL